LFDWAIQDCTQERGHSAPQSLEPDLGKLPPGTTHSSSLYFLCNINCEAGDQEINIYKNERTQNELTTSQILVKERQFSLSFFMFIDLQ
jgi:hypothetical protein